MRGNLPVKLYRLSQDELLASLARLLQALFELRNGEELALATLNFGAACRQHLSVPGRRLNRVGCSRQRSPQQLHGLKAFPETHLLDLSGLNHAQTLPPQARLRKPVRHGLGRNLLVMIRRR